MFLLQYLTFICEASEENHKPFANN